MSECPVAHQFFESMYEQVYQDQTYKAYRPENNPYFNAYNSDWGAPPNFFMKTIIDGYSDDTKIYIHRRTLL